MFGLLSIYLVCGISGLCVERLLRSNSLLKRIILIFAVAAAQLNLAIQLLSLFQSLTGPRLLLANLILTAMVAGTLGRRKPAPGRAPWKELLMRARTDLLLVLKQPLVALLTIVALAFFFLGCVTGFLMLPLGDTYHFEMPLFWIQHQSLLPFPVHNPRLVALSFLSEALGLPGFLYAKSPVMPAILTFIGGLLTLWIVFSLARRIGAGVSAALCAAMIATGYTRFAMELLAAGADALFAGAFFGASILFLMDARSRAETQAGRNGELMASLFCFVMACGAKNSTILLAPFFASALVLVLFGRAVRQNAEPTQTPAPRFGLAPLLLCLALTGFAGLLCSGVAWNYTANKLWFGNSRGPQIINETVSRDFHPRAIWTRLCRGTVLLIYDTVWVPGSACSAYASLCQKTVSLLGGQAELAEDNIYYSFRPTTRTARKGAGLLGLTFFLPGVAWALLRCLRPGQACATRLDSLAESDPHSVPNTRFNLALLVILTLGSFLMCHLVLRWQPIGMLRLMFPFLIVGAPLASLLLEPRWAKVAALVLLLVSAAMFLTLWFGNVSRRLGWQDHPAARVIARLQNYHRMPVQYKWRDQPPCDFFAEEDYTYREIYERFLAGINQPCHLGIVGFMNAECAWLFGSRFQNRVIPLVDARTFEAINDPPEDLDFVVAVDKFSEIGPWAERHGFKPIFEASSAGNKLLLGFEKVRKP